MKAARRARHTGDPDDFHALRIRAKRLRYALEFVSELYPGQTAKYVRDVVRLQDTLGLMQDARVATQRLHELATTPSSGLSPTTVFVMGGIAERYSREAETLAQAVPGCMKTLRGTGWRRTIGAMEHRKSDHPSLSRWPAPLAGAVPPRPPLPGRADPGDGRARTPWVRQPETNRPPPPPARNDHGRVDAPRPASTAPSAARPGESEDPTTSPPARSSPTTSSPGDANSTADAPSRNGGRSGHDPN
jgi:hypothetical protein